MTAEADRSRHARGVSAYASQFGIPEAEVESYLGSLIGARMAGESIAAQGGGAWEEGVLSLRDRSLVVLASLITQGGAEARLRGHIRWAVEHHVTPEQIEELCTLLAIYAGYPRAATAMETIREELPSLRSAP
jgi:alkylhydroperoxidase/carboxymuconolactone decarboxylase family protein YurZ